MRLKFLLAIAPFFVVLQCRERDTESFAVKEGRELITSTHRKYSENKALLAEHRQDIQDFDLAKFIRGNTQVTLDLYAGIKALAKKYPETSAKFADKPIVLGRQLGADIKPLFATVNQLAADIRIAMQRHPDKKGTAKEYQELTIIWLKVLALFGGELRQG